MAPKNAQAHQAVDATQLHSRPFGWRFASDNNDKDTRLCPEPGAHISCGTSIYVCVCCCSFSPSQCVCVYVCQSMQIKAFYFSCCLETIYMLITRISTCRVAALCLCMLCCVVCVVCVSVHDAHSIRFVRSCDERRTAVHTHERMPQTIRRTHDEYDVCTTRTFFARLHMMCCCVRMRCRFDSFHVSTCTCAVDDPRTFRTISRRWSGAVRAEMADNQRCDER